MNAAPTVPPILTYSDLRRGVEPDFVMELQRSRVLSRDVIRMVIPDRTLERRKAKAEVLREEEADAIARLLRVLAHAHQVFEDSEVAEAWLSSPNPELGGDVPIEMARTDLGAREAEAVLTRLEHGVFG